MQLALPVISGLINLFRDNTAQIAQKSGVEEGVVQQVLCAVEHYATKEERYARFLAEQVDLARRHDSGLTAHTSRAMNDLRAAVRPVVSFIAIGWYVYARMMQIPLTQEDYAIIGGVLMFWFGMRPFEKRNEK